MPVAIQAQHVRKVYPGSPPGTAALDDLSLEIPTGRIYGLIGRNGAGKTTFVRIAATQLAPTSGEVTVLGYNCLLYTSPSPRDPKTSRMPSSA